jgi:hypothetical protein
MRWRVVDHYAAGYSISNSDTGTIGSFVNGSPEQVVQPIHVDTSKAFPTEIDRPLLWSCARVRA